jgi:hypothetical protein
MAALQEAGEEFRKLHTTLLQAQEALKGKNADDAAVVRKVIQDTQEAEKLVLQKKRQGVKDGAADLVQHALNSLLQDPDLWNENAPRLQAFWQEASTESREALNQIRAKLISFGIAENTNGSAFQIKPDKGGLTRFERGMIERWNGVVIGRLLFQGVVESKWRENYVDPRITSVKEWRDVYRYYPDGTAAGWRRYEPGSVLEFNAEGLLVLDRDSHGRCTRARVVRYELEPQNSSPTRNRVKLIQTDTLREYEYEGPNDWKGRIKR